MSTAVVDPAPRTGPNPLWSKDFSLFFTARGVSLLGDAMHVVALAVAVLGLGYGAGGVGAAMAAFMGPWALLVIFGGVLADRFTPRRMMIGADLVRVVVHGTLALTVAVAHPPLWTVLVLVAVSGVATAMFQPGVASMVPAISHDIQRANATLRVTEATVAMVGPSVAGGLLVFASPALIFGIDALTFGTSAVCLLLLRVADGPVEAEHDAPASVWRRLAVGWSEFRSRTWLWTVIVAWAVNGLLVWGPLRPLAATLLVTGSGSRGYGLVLTGMGIGTVLGGLVGMRVRPARPLRAGTAVMLATAPLNILSLVLGWPIWLVFTCYVVTGTGWAFWGVMWSTTLQTSVPQEVLNRVYSYDVAGSIISMPIGQLLVGPAVPLLGARHVLGVSLVVCVASFTALLLVPSVRRLTREDGRRARHHR